MQQDLLASYTSGSLSLSLNVKWMNLENINSETSITGYPSTTVPLTLVDILYGPTQNLPLLLIKYCSQVCIMDTLLRLVSKGGLICVYNKGIPLYFNPRLKYRR